MTDDHYIDPIAVERTINGDRPTRLTPAERAHVVRTMAAAGHTDTHIADRLRCSDRTIQRIRAAHNIPTRWHQHRPWPVHDVHTALLNNPAGLLTRDLAATLHRTPDQIRYALRVLRRNGHATHTPAGGTTYRYHATTHQQHAGAA